MVQNRQVTLLGDSILKGIQVDLGDRRYRTHNEINVEALESEFQLSIHNDAHFGATVRKGSRLLDRMLARKLPCDMMVMDFGGNDCDFDWQAVSDRPEEAHLPKIPAEQFLENYRALMDLVRQTASRVWISSLVPLEAHRFLDHVSQGRSRENILTWLGDTDRIFRWQEYYNDLVCRLSRELSCPLLELRPEFLKDPAFPALLSMDGIHPTQKGHDVIHRCVAEAIF